MYLSSSVLDLISCDFVIIKLHCYIREIFYSWGKKEIIFSHSDFYMSEF